MFSWIPLIALAQQSGTSPTIKQIMYKLSYYVINPLIQVGFVVALVVFIWGVVEYVRDKDGGVVMGRRNQRGGDGASHIIWGLVGLLIMVSAFAIMSTLKNLIGSNIATP